MTEDRSIDVEPAPPRRRLARDLPPLFGVTVLIVVLALVMPSALRVPQQDPTPVLEYAPVPPTDDDAPNPQGNLSSLALGSSDTLEEGSVTPPPAKARGKSPKDKQCTGKPARQTEDPMSPPCVPYFDGDNGGATWQGVTRDEIVVAVYFDTGNYNMESSPEGGTFIDIDKPPLPPCPKESGNTNPDSCDQMLIRHTRGMATYFNNRFQTYNRHVHFWAYFATGGGEVGRRNDAAAIFDRLHPFAVIDQATFGGGNQAFEDVLAARGVLVFTSQAAIPNAFFNRYPAFSWGFWPDVEHWAALFVDYVCKRIEPYPVRYMGSAQGVDPHVGRPRRYGLFYTSDPREPGLIRFREIIKRQLPARCDLTWVAEADFPRNRFVTDAGDPGEAQVDAVAKFINEDVTTVLYLGGVEGKFSQFAADAGYFPEIVLADDLFQGNNVTAREQDQRTWKNAWGMQFQIRMGRADETPGYAAYREVYQEAPIEEARYVNEFYRDHFMLFQAIQVAGPRLSPKTVDEGFHAIPPKASTGPEIGSCFFDPRDYSCLKDATEIWWDPTGQSPGDGKPGCWRLVDEGKRYLAGAWTAADRVFRSGAPCSGYDAARRLSLG